MEGLNGRLIKEGSLPIPTLSGLTGISKYVGTDAFGNKGVFDLRNYENGLTLTGDTVQLGGELLLNTIIDGKTHDLILKRTYQNAFNVGTGFNDYVQTIAIQSDNKTICGGGFTSYDGNTRNRIIRLNADGSIDNTFSIGTGFDNDVITIVIQSDGKIICGGTFTSYNGNTTNYIVRLNADGSIDNTFSIGTGFDDTVQTINIQSDNKIVCSGIFTSYDGNTTNGIVRLNSNGSIDGTYSVGTGFNDTPLDSVIQSDDKIVFVGFFTSYNGNTRNRVVRINTDGTIDGTYSVGTGFNTSTTSIAIQSDGKTIIGGQFTSYNGNSRNRIIRLNTDGSVDSGFTIGTGFNGACDEITIQSDGKIICGGEFTSYNGNSRNRIVRINTDGSIDSGFTIGTGFDDSLASIKIDINDKILVGGYFTTYDGNSSNCFVRLNTDGTIDDTALTYQVILTDSGLFQYDQKLHDYYNNRTLIDKEYVDLLINSEFDEKFSFSGATDGMALVYFSATTKFEPTYYDYNNLINLPSSPEYGTMLFVSKNGNDSTGTRRRLDKPYLTIQAAINAATAGDTIGIYDGTYTESLTITSKNLQFIGYGKIIINGLLSITSSNIEFDNIKFKNSSGRNISTTSSNIILKNSDLDASTTEHLVNSGTSNLLVRNVIGNKNLSNDTYTTEESFLYILKTDFTI